MKKNDIFPMISIFITFGMYLINFANKDNR